MKIIKRVMVSAFTAAVLLSFSVILPAFDDSDFISIAPVEKQDSGDVLKADTVVEKPVKPPAAPKTKEIANADRVFAVELNDRIEVRIVASQKVKYKATELAPPPSPRILVQLSECAVKTSTINVGKGSVRAIRTAPHGDTAWVVIDLTEKSRWKAREEGTIVIIEIPKQAGAARAEAKPVEARPVPPGSLLYRVVDVAGRNIGKKTRVIVTADGPVKYRLRKDSGGKALSLSIMDAVSTWKEGSLTIQDSPVDKVTISEDSRNKVVELKIALTENTPYTVTRDQNQILVDIDNPVDMGKLPKRKLDLYQKISLNVQSATLPGLLRLISTQTGFEFSVSPSVAAASPVTIRYDDQTLERVLREILIPGGFYYEVSDGIIKIGTVAELKAAKNLRPKVTKFYYPKSMKADNLVSLAEVQIGKHPLLDVAVQADANPGANRVMLVGTREDVDKAIDMLNITDVVGGRSGSDYSRGQDEEGYMFTRVYKLNNMRLMHDGSVNEQDWFNEMQSAIERMKSPEGQYQIDRRTSSIILYDSGGAHTRIATMLKGIDVKVPQVTIEAKLYEISLTETKDLGVKWSAVGQAAEPFIQGDVQAGAPVVAGSSGGLLTLGTMMSGMKIDAYLRALEVKNKATLLSSPKVTVESNQPATIRTSRRVNYAEQSIVTSQTGPPIITSVYKELNLPIELRVHSKITTENTINMLIHLNVEKIVAAAQGEGPPDTSSQLASTYVNAKNNETIVIGGLISERNIEVNEKVPLLGDLPLLGALFRGTKIQNEQVELVVFLTPSIVED
ncbi:MAG TPA: hypothetical protein ENN43_07375 [bacterium]|nr:hypothetical protein [bacterium]